MADRIKLHRRLANLARWEYQQCAADLASSVARLRQLQRHCDALAAEIATLNEEQLKALSAGEFSTEQQLAAQGLAGELAQRLQDWEGAADECLRQVGERRTRLAAARRKQRRTEDRFEELKRNTQLDYAAREARELEGIYISNFGRRN
jgi:phage shock protein A